VLFPQYLFLFLLLGSFVFLISFLFPCLGLPGLFEGLWFSFGFCFVFGFGFVGWVAMFSGCTCSVVLSFVFLSFLIQFFVFVSNSLSCSF